MQLIRRTATFLSLVSCLALLTFALPGAARAQSGDGVAVIGRVVSEVGEEALAGANVVLRRPSDGSALVTSATNDSGRFLLTRVRPGAYVLEVSYLGYATLTEDVTIAESGPVDLGVLRLTQEAILLSEVTVETERPQAVFAPDRDIYAAAELPVAAGGVATELLSGIPELDVDIDGSISLRGSTPQIYLNGRPAPMDGEALNVFLEQFPADRIERIEVIPNPSARFSADGAGGIINIVLKEGVELGMSGSVFANVHSRGEAGGGGRLTWQKGRFTIFGNAFLRRSDRDDYSYDLRQNLVSETTSFLEQESWTDRGGLSGSGDLTAELKLGERSVLRAEGRFSDYGSDSDSRRTTTHMDDEQLWTQRYTRDTHSESTRRSMDVALSFTQEFSDPRHKLEVELELEGGRNDQDQRVETEYELLPDDDRFLPSALLLEDVDNRDRETTFKMDYVRPWGDDGQIEVGYRGRLQSRENDRLRETFEDGGAPVESTLRGFEHREMYNSAYLTLTRNIGAFGIQIGGRAQRADTRFGLPSGETYENDHLDFFPSGNLTYDFGEGRRLRLSYSRRVRRPSPWRLNPVDESTDPLNRRVGNPDLEPQYTHSVGLDMSTSTSWGTLRLSPYYRLVTNDWARIQRVDEDGVSTTTWENLSSQQMMGASVTAAIRRIAGWGGFVNLSVRHEDRDAEHLGANVSGSSFWWSLRGNLSGRITPDLSVRTMLSYTPARDVPQGRVSSRVMSSVGLRQQFMDGRMSVGLNVRDPFDMADSSFESRDPTFVQIGRTERSLRSASLSVSYTFGGTRGGAAARQGGPGRGGGRR